MPDQQQITVPAPRAAGSTVDDPAGDLLLLGIRDAASLSRHSDPDHEAWEITLDRLELDVVRAERALAAGRELHTDAWETPRHHGPIPHDLVERAQEILLRQQALLRTLAETLGSTHRQQQLAERLVSGAPRMGAPVYVDVSA